MNIFVVARSRDNKYEFFAYVISQKWRVTLRKKTSEQRFGGKTKPTYQNSAIFEHFENGQKI